MAVVIVKTDDLMLASHVEPLEETVDKMEDTLKFSHIERLNAGKCTVDGGIVFLELLTNLCLLYTSQGRESYRLYGSDQAGSA